jgi:hypothetical protein
VEGRRDGGEAVGRRRGVERGDLVEDGAELEGRPRAKDRNNLSKLSAEDSGATASRANEASKISPRNMSTIYPVDCAQKSSGASSSRWPLAATP